MRQMKNSGIEWLGEIPENWKLIPFRYVLKERQEKNSPIKSTERLSLSIDLGITLYSEKTTNLDRFKEDFEQYKLAHSGDLVMNSMNMIVGATGVSKYYGCVSPVYYTFYDELDDHCTAKFCEYIFKSKPMLRYLFSIGKGIYAIARGDDRVNTCRLKVSKEDLKSTIIPVPSIDEQRKIISFLDKHCAEADAIIEKTKATIEEYKKLKQSVITKAVTKGIRGNRPMKDSGIEWIGTFPKEWTFAELKMFCSVNNGKEISNEVDKDTEGSIGVYGSGGVFKYTDSYMYDGTTVMFGRKGTLGKPLYVTGKVWVVDTMYYLTYSTKLIPKFNYYQLWAFDWQPHITQTALPSIVASQIVACKFAMPDLQEQEEIINYLDSKCAEIDKLIADKTHLLEEMENYKKSVIYEYVTGKKEV